MDRRPANFVRAGITRGGGRTARGRRARTCPYARLHACVHDRRPLRRPAHEAGRRHRRHGPHRNAPRQDAQGPRRRRLRPVAQPRARERAARRRGVRVGARRAAARPPRRSPAATPSSTSPARTSASAGARTPRPRSPRAARRARATSSPGSSPPTPRPPALIGASASGYYGPRGDEVVDETGAARHRLARGGLRALGAADRRGEARPARREGAHGDRARRRGRRARRRCCRLSRPALGGSIGSGKQYMPWIHLDDLVGIYLAAIDHATFSGPSTRRRRAR